MNDYNKILLNPIRMRIIQYLGTHKTVTAGELVSVMKDIPRTTLYRHINKLQESNIITIISENRIRGTVEKVYALNISTLSSQNTNQNARNNTYGFLMKILSDFEKYYKNENADPKKDKLFLYNTVLLMSDEEYNSFLKELGDIIIEHINKEPSADRKPRNLSIISTPNIE